MTKHFCSRIANPPACIHSPTPGRLAKLTVSVCVDGFHKEGISSVQALLQAGSGVLWSSGVQACKDSSKSGAPFLLAAAA